MTSTRCKKQTEEMLYAFVEGDLDEQRADEIRRHADQCDTCRAIVLDAISAESTLRILRRKPFNDRDRERISRWTAETLRLLTPEHE